MAFNANPMTFGPGAMLLEMGSGGSTMAQFWDLGSAVGVSISGRDVTKTAAVGWGTGALSVQSLPASAAYGRCSTAENNKAKLVALSRANPGYTEGSTDYAIYMDGFGNLYVYDFYTVKYTGTCVANDTLLIRSTGGAVTYWKNGGLLYTSLVAPVGPLFLTTSMFSTGATIKSASLETS